MTAQHLATLAAKLDQFWDLLEKHPDSPKFAAREERFLQLLKEYERTCDGLHHTRRKDV